MEVENAGVMKARGRGWGLWMDWRENLMEWEVNIISEEVMNFDVVSLELVILAEEIR
jgi:hypothetical protein